MPFGGSYTMKLSAKKHFPANIATVKLGSAFQIVASC